MSFDANDPRITAFALGELEGGELEKFVAEMEANEDLRNLVSETSETLGLLADDLKAQPSVGLSDSQRAAVVKKFDEASPSAPLPPVVQPAASQPPKAASPSRRASMFMILGSTAIVALGLFAIVGVASWYTSTQVMQREMALADHRLADGNAVRAEEARIRSEMFNLEMPGADGAADYVQLAEETPRSSTRALTSRKVVDDVLIADFAEKRVAAESARAMWELREAKRSEAAVKQAQTAGQPQSQLSSVGAAGSGSAVPPGNETLQSSIPEAAEFGLGGGGSLGGMGPGRGFGIAGLSKSLRGVREFEDRRLADGEDALGLDVGKGPGQAGDQHELIVENDFLSAGDHPLSTFSIDVDTAAYSKVRMYLMQHNQFPRRDAVRIEELVNYFPYAYEPPEDDRPFAARMEVAQCPWNNRHRLLRVAIKGKEIASEKRPSSNLVFLLDVSGSMRKPNKLPLLKRGMKMLVDQLGENDRVAIVVYAGAAGLVLDSTNGDEKATIIEALDRLRAGGSTNGGAGVHLAYQTALDNYIKGGVNRVILCTDGDFNVGITGNDNLSQLAERNAKTGVFLSVLGFGMGNHNDAMLESISNKGNGNYAFIDSDAEARKVLVEQMSGTLVTIAKDVKIQVEFNPSEVGAYRLIGYENRILAAKDFNDDKKDAGEIGAGHNVTALYEIVPAGKDKKLELPEVDSLKYQRKRKLTKDANSGELLTLKLRYKEPDGDKSKLLEFPLRDEGKRFGDTDKDFRFAASVASFGMLLRNSPHKGDATYDAVLEIASEAASDDETGYRSEFINIVNRAKMIVGQQR